VTLNVPGGYATIQAAVDAASAGDTIEVQSGTYNENVDVNKQLTLRGVGWPVVDASGSGSAITISAEGCILQGFVARNSRSASGFDSGITVISNGATISGNNATGNDNGIHIYRSTGSTISGNTATGNSNTGIIIGYSSNNIVTSNIANYNSRYGIYIRQSDGNTISGNTATGNSGFGIGLISSRNNNISDNNATDNFIHGIYLLSSSGNTIRDNDATDNTGDGINIDTSSNNNISGNAITGNSYGITIDASSGNTIYLNTFDNTNNAQSDSNDNWNATTLQTSVHNGRTLTGFLGNIWSDYDGFDCDHDGVGDTPYIIVGGSGRDLHPIGGKEPGLEVKKIADRDAALVGDWINYTIWANNTGEGDLTNVLVEDNLTKTVWTVGTLLESQNFISTTKYQVKLSDLPGPLTNKLWANGTNPCGYEINNSSIETVDISYLSQIMVNKTANITEGVKSTVIDFNIEVTNNGNADFVTVDVEDLLPVGLDYLSDDSGLTPARAGNSFTWNLGRLNSSKTVSFNLTARINGEKFSDLVNLVNATGDTGYGDPVSASATAIVTSSNICLSGRNLLASTGAGLANWNITATDSAGLVFNATTDSIGHWEICNISVGSYTVCEQLKDGWIQVKPKGCYNVVLTNESISDLDFANDLTCNLTLTKTADVPVAHRGEDITYSIDLSNPRAWGSFTNVTLWDILPKSVELVSVSPTPSSSSSSNLTWDVGTLGPYQHFPATIVVRVPIVDINYDSSQTVRGEGFVNVHNDYDTHQGPESVTNCAYAKADLVETISSCASTKIIDPGTQLQSREFGSGTYESEELIRMRTENKSIRSVSNVSAVHRSTTFALPQNRSIDYGTKWTEKSWGINTITGATMSEEYTSANKIEKDRSIELDRNGSTMKTEVEIEGIGHIGVLKKESPDAHPKVKPIFESSEDFVGSFKATEMVDEYGSSVQSNKSITGYGYVAVDKRVRDSQRTYESGTGSYESDEIIDTPTNYIAKEISLVHGPTNYSYSPQFNVNQDIKWTEGMWSKTGTLRGGDIFKDSSNCGVPVAKVDNSSPPASYISERYSSLDFLKKDSVALGLNEMKTNASFNGMADYRVLSVGTNRSNKIDNEERYVGQYAVTRNVRIGGVSKYDLPHITVTKEGRLASKWFNKTNANVAEYAITITNDGTSSLAPINVRDIFPPGTEYIGSSIRPSSLSGGSANWTLLNLGIGNSVTINLTLNLTDYAPANVVNRVMVCGMKGDECISAATYSSLESGSMGCCPPEVFVDKTAKLDALDPMLVHYTILVKNNANNIIAATLTDKLPTGMSLLQASLEPNMYGGLLMQWVIPDLAPGEVETIEYDLRATMDGTYVNAVQVDATAVDGSGYATEEAAARIDIGSTGVEPKTTRYGGWQAPNWNMTSPDEGITIELSPDDDIVE
jgi:uncharacterized repeat protein (TIGR01451 family)